MTTISASHGTDTHVRDTNPNRNYAGGNVIRLQNTHRRGFIHIPVTDIRGRTVLSATLTGHVHSGFVSQTVSVHAVASSWSAGKTTWNRQPSVGAHVNTTLGALSDGDTADLDVTALVQSAANGTKWRGVRLSTDAATADTSNWYAFDATKPAWTLTIELSDAPEQPSDLRPNQGAVASGAPILSWSYTDLGGDSSEQGAFQVQVDPDADATSPGFDTGWVTSVDPEYDLASGSFTPLGSGDDTQWRVRTKDATGNISVWSDWAAFSYEPYATLVMDSPTGGVIGDATPDIIAHLTGGTLDHWHAAVLDSVGNHLWGSGLQDGDISITVPARNDWFSSPFYYGSRVISRDDATYQIRVRAWDNIDRADAVGLPAYVQQIVTVVFDDDAGVTVPGDFTVTPVAPGDPRTVFGWTRDEAPDAVLILDDGDVYARLDEDDWTLDAGVYTWNDRGIGQPRVAHHFTLRAVESGVRSHATSSITYTSRPDDLWIIPDNGDDPVRLRFRASVDQFTNSDRRATYKPPATGRDVDIVYSLEGFSGPIAGNLTQYTPGQNVNTAVAILNRLKKDPYARPQLVFARFSFPAIVRNMTVVASSDFDDDNLRHRVAFDFIRDGD